jgi:hypothetical protein
MYGFSGDVQTLHYTQGRGPGATGARCLHGGVGKPVNYVDDSFCHMINDIRHRRIYQPDGVFKVKVSDKF